MFTEEEKKELARLLFIASMTESDRMNETGVENALFFIKKIKLINIVAKIEEETKQ